MDQTLTAMTLGWWTALVGILLLGLLAWGTVLLRRKGVSTPWLTGLGALRVMIIALFLLCLVRPAWRYTSRSVERPDLLMLLDTSASMGPAEGETTPGRLAETLQSMQESGLRKALEDSYDVHWFAFDRDARPIAPDAAAALEASGKSTRLARGLQTAWDYHRLRAGHTADDDRGRARALVVSDGNDNGAGKPLEVARSLGLRVDVLAPPEKTQPAAPPRVSVTDLQGSRTVLFGSESRFRARIRREGPVEGPIMLELAQDGEPVLKRQMSFGPDQVERRVELGHRPGGVGMKSYSLSARPVDGGPAFEQGPARSVTVKVIARNREVLILEDTWRWDFRFLRRLLEGDPHFSFTAFLSRGPGIYVQFAEPDSSVELGGFPRSGAELEWFDTIVLGDVKPGDWPRDLAPAIHRMVADRGKTLIVIAGPGIRRFRDVPSLERLLPVEIPADSGLTEGPVRAQPSPDGASSPVFYSPGKAGPLAAWEDLPPLDQIYAPRRKRPAATVLLEAPDRSNEFGNLIVMAEHTVGRGRVLYVGTDTLWKWQMLAAEDDEGRSPYQVFWQQALRAFAPIRPSGRAVHLWVQTDRSSYLSDQTVRLEIELEDRGSAENALVEAMVSTPDGRELPAALKPHPDRPHVLIAEFQPPIAGQYTVTGSAEAQGKQVAENSTVIQVLEQSAERNQRGNNQKALQRLALETGGNLVRPDDPEAWPLPDPAETGVVRTSRTVDLWGSSLLLLVLAGVLGIDWLVRLLGGFV